MMGDIESQDKLKKIFSYAKYVLILLALIPIYLIADHYIYTYGDLEKDLTKLAKKYIKENNIQITDNYYLPLGALGEVEGAELCSNASGVIVTRNGNKYSYDTYLNCFDYESKIVKNKEKKMFLIGESVMLLNLNEIYEEKGYYTEEDVDVLESGIVQNREGIYTLTYTARQNNKVKEVLTRKVIVTSYDKNSTNSGVTSNEVPTLTLMGNTTMLLERGEKYVEPGYRAVDYRDGKVTRKVEISYPNGNVNTSKPGTYNIVYTITNSDRKSNVKTRIVKVVEEKSDIVIDSKIKKQTTGYVINLVITGSGYTHTITPDGLSIPDTIINYPVNKNGHYTFAVYDIFNNVNVRTVDVNDVDITGPTGSCIANVGNGKTTVAISASDKGGISGYNYIIDGNTSEFIKSSNYSLNTTAKKVMTQVKDSYGNTTTMTCKIYNISGSTGSMKNGVMDIPLYLQTRYTTPIPYGKGNVTTVKKTGCGPTSVSMIVTYFTGNVTQNPQNIFEWLVSFGNYGGHGFGRPALVKAAAKYGVTCEWKNLNIDSMKATLLSGKPIIAYMGKGTFTSGGHYIVLKGVTEDGKIAINDPFSESRSKKTWDPALIVRESVSSKAFGVCSI